MCMYKLYYSLMFENSMYLLPCYVFGLFNYLAVMYTLFDWPKLVAMLVTPHVAGTQSQIRRTSVLHLLLCAVIGTEAMIQLSVG